MGDRWILRPLDVDDAERLSRAFAAIGWSRPSSVFEGYLAEQAEGLRWTRVAEVDGEVAGYVTIAWSPADPVLRREGIPEIMDLNVLPPFRERGLASTLLDVAEAEASNRAPRVGLRVGLHSGFGAAQRLYVRRGYVPDGCGVLIDGQVIPEGASIRLNDDVTLRMIKHLGDGR